MEIHNRTSPVVGRIHERPVGLVKKCLKKTIGKAYLTMTDSCPLTYPSVDIYDASPLTPSHFLCGHRLLTLPDRSVSAKESDPVCIPTDVSTKS